MIENSQEFLKKVSQTFIADTFFVPVIGVELEFYLRGNYEENEIIQKISDELTKNEINIHHFDPEEGAGQFEISLAADANATIIANNIQITKDIITKIATENNLQAHFSAKPFADSAGNSMQFHISLLNKDFQNIFQKEGEQETDQMLYAIGGLLEAMPEDLKHFIPNEEGKQRIEQDIYAPKTISWGGNNRTVALRLPTTTATPQHRRIEHRVPSADCDPYLILGLILQAIKNGIVNKTMPSSDKIYGDASLDMYKLPKISTHL